MPRFLFMIDYNTFFIRAVELGNYEQVQKMLYLGSSINATSSAYGSPRTALWIAAMHQYKNIVQLLLDNGADYDLHINDEGTEFPNILYMLVWDTELTLRLIGEGLDPRAECPLGLNLAWWAAYAENTSLVKQLDRLGV